MFALCPPPPPLFFPYIEHLSSDYSINPIAPAGRPDYIVINCYA